MNTQMTIKSILNRVILPILLLAPVIAGAKPGAQDGGGGKKPTEDKLEIGELPLVTGTNQGTNLVDSIELVIQWALGFIGIVVFLIFLFAGFEYATAGGDEGKATTARTRMVNAVIGLIIIFFAFVASNTILSFIFTERT